MSALTEAKVNIGTAEAPVLIDAIVYRLLVENPDKVFSGVVTGSLQYEDDQLEVMLKFQSVGTHV